MKTSCLHFPTVQSLHYKTSGKASWNKPSDHRTKPFFFPFQDQPVFLSSDRLKKNGNRKLHDIWVLDMPSGVTCTRFCKGCYARKAERLYPDTYNHRIANFMLSHYQPDTFDNLLDTQLNEIEHTEKDPIVRIHSAGDFYSLSYYQRIAAVVRNHRKTRFFAFSKSSWVFSRKAPTNLSLIDSRSPFNGKNYTSDTLKLELAQKQGYHLCKASLGTGLKCNLDCQYCFTTSKPQVVFKEH